MQGIYFQYGLLAALAIGLLIAAFTDIRTRKIANWLNGAIALGAPLFWWARGLSFLPSGPSYFDPSSIAVQIALAITVFLILAILFAMGGMGGGDVKLLTALALWVEPAHFLQLLIIMALVGGILTLVTGAWHIMRRQRNKIAVPYGVAIASAGLWILCAQYLPTTPASTGGLG